MPLFSLGQYKSHRNILKMEFGSFTRNAERTLISFTTLAESIFIYQSFEINISPFSFGRFEITTVFAYFIH